MVFVKGGFFYERVENGHVQESRASALSLGSEFSPRSIYTNVLNRGEKGVFSPADRL